MGGHAPPRGRRTTYLSDLTDAQWAVIRSLLPPPMRGRTGRPRTYPLRGIWKAICYRDRGGCAWRALPHDFPPWAGRGQADVWDPRPPLAHGRHARAGA